MSNNPQISPERRLLVPLLIGAAGVVLGIAHFFFGLTLLESSGWFNTFGAALMLYPTIIVVTAIIAGLARGTAVGKFSAWTAFFAIGAEVGLVLTFFGMLSGAH